MSEKLTIEKTITIAFEAIETEEGEQVGKDGKRFFHVYPQFFTKGMLPYYKEVMIEAAQEKDMERFNRCLEDYINFRLAEMAGVEALPIHIKKPKQSEVKT